MLAEDDGIVDVRKFESDIVRAKQGDGWLEADEQTIRIHFPNGIKQGPGLVPYVIYKGVKVCLKGDKERCQDIEDEQGGRRIHGPTEALMDNR